MTPDHETGHAPQASRPPSRWRVLFAVVPAIVIIVTAASLIGVGTAPEPAPASGSAAFDQDARGDREHAMSETLPAPILPDLDTRTSDAKAVVARLGAADPERGAREFRMCAPCHTASPDAGSRLGPNLWNVVGRQKAALPDFAYSAALASRGGTWTDEELAAYLHDPRGYLPGTKMAFRGIEDAGRIADIVVYLRQLSDTGQPPRN